MPDLFWIHRDQIYEQGLSTGFRVFSMGHLIWLAAIALFCYLSGRYYRGLDEKGRDNMRKASGLTLILLEYAKMTVLGLFGIRSIEFLPLHLCSVGGLAVAVYAMWPGRKWIGQLFAFDFFPAGILAIVFPSTTMYPWWNFYSIHTFVFHGLMMAFFIWLAMGHEVVPDYKGLWISYGLAMLMAVPIYFLNGAFSVNYMFIGTRSDVGVLATLWDMLVPRFGRAGYAVIFCLILLLVQHIFYGIYTLVWKLGGRTDKR